jgi:hypothetical protein
VVEGDADLEIIPRWDRPRDAFDACLRFDIVASNVKDSLPSAGTGCAVRPCSAWTPASGHRAWAAARRYLTAAARLTFSRTEHEQLTL